MVFANLPIYEKRAFFSLLDEYFASRPEIFANSGAGGRSNTDEDDDDALHTTGAAAASAVHRALASSNPEATSKLISAGFERGVPKSSPYAAVRRYESSGGKHLWRSLRMRRQMAQITLSITKNRHPKHLHVDQAPRPSSGAGKAESEMPNANADVPRVDVSSARSMFESMRHPYANNNKNELSSVPPASGMTKKNAFAPPPVRRVSSGATPTPTPPPPPVRQQTVEEDEDGEGQGEWAEALYDFTSAESTDLELEANQRVLITEKTSDDWWTGEIDGRKGLFPSAYVKIL